MYLTKEVIQGAEGMKFENGVKVQPGTRYRTLRP